MTSKARRTVKLVLGSLAGLVLLAVGVIGWTSSRRIGHLYPMEERSITVPAVPDTARGERLATTMSLCTQCHQDDLGGQVLEDNPVFRAAPPNLTSGEGGIGADLSLVRFANAVRRGIHPDRTSMILMPSSAYSGMSDADVVALWVYVKSRPPVQRNSGRSFMKGMGRALVAAGKFKLSADSAGLVMPPVETPTETMALGKYLTGIAGCEYCHGSNLRGRSEPVGPPGSPLPPDITPSGVTAQWTEADFIKAIRTGVRPDGSAIRPQMPWQEFAKMTDEELHSIWTYIRAR